MSEKPTRTDTEPETTSINKGTILAGVFILAAFGIFAFALSSGGEEEESEAQQTEEQQQEPRQTVRSTFLDQPVRKPDTSTALVNEPSPQQPLASTLSGHPPEFSNPPRGPGYSQSYAPAYGQPQTQQPQASPREQQYEAAKSADLELISGSETSTQNPRRQQSTFQDTTGFQPAAGNFLASMGAQQNRQPQQQQQSSFQQRLSQNSGTAYHASVEEPQGNFRIPAGNVIPAVLTTSVNSDLPGPVIARTMRDVYDSNMQHVLIPKGSKLIGTYDDQLALGQERLMVAWTRIMLPPPNGKSIQLPGLRSADLDGATGLSDDVDKHYGRVFASAALLSGMGAGFQLTQPQGGGFGQRSTQSIVGAEVGREMSRVASQMMQQQLNVEPTVTIRKGYQFYVLLNKDLTFDQPYQAAPAVKRFRAPDSVPSTSPTFTNR